MAAAQVLRIVRQLEQALRIWPSLGAPPPEALQAVEAAQRGAAAHGHADWAAALAHTPLTRECLVAIAAEARGTYHDEAAARSALRRDGWRQFVVDDVAAGGKRAFRWIRQPAAQAPPPLVLTPGGLAGGPAAEVEQAAAAWHALWARPDAPPAAEAALLGAFRGLPAFPALPPLTDAAVAAAARPLPLGKAPRP